MAIALNTQEAAETTQSLKAYFRSELETELSDLRAKLLLDYILKEIAPFAYNQGVKDAEEYMRARLEDMSATCFEPALTYWQKKRK